MKAPAAAGSSSPDLSLAADGRLLLSWINRREGRRSALQAGPDFLTQPVARFMTRSPKVIRDDALGVDALRLFEAHRIDDPVQVAGNIVGRHQFDGCQLLGHGNGWKYERQGGLASIPLLVAALRRRAQKGASHTG